jgi:NAD(P)H-dependent flavin oxidoreductase YrpB (nitropropane dioxygenase family)
LTSKGVIPHEKELEAHPEKSIKGRAWLMGSVAALIDDVLPAKEIVERMVAEAVEILKHGNSLLKADSSRAKL